MSGGVDSSVSAALLKQQGFDVTGVFIKTWQPDWLECNWKEDRRDAMRVAATLGIPFLTLDLEREYKQEVADYMVSEYKVGRTPNPDVMCNKQVKFGAFLQFARKSGADFIATGHYARIQKRNATYSLLTGNDANKDQSYFLWTLTQEALSHTLFPVGEYQKSEVRTIAEDFNLPTAQKKDSQGVCFLGKLDMSEFLSHYIEQKQGDVLNEKGEVVGHHNGALLYTNGQRHGFTVTSKGIEDKPRYVVDRDIQKNTITVTKKKTLEQHFTTRTVVISDTNWIGTKTIDPAKIYSARFRYRQQLESCTIKQTSDTTTTIHFTTDQTAVSAGQSMVLYDGEICLGGGTIEKTE